MIELAGFSGITIQKNDFTWQRRPSTSLTELLIFHLPAAMQSNLSAGNLTSLLAKDGYTAQEQQELNSLCGSYAYANQTDRLYYSIYIALNHDLCCIDYTICLGLMAAIVEKPLPLDYLTSVKKICCAEIRIEVNNRRLTPFTPEDAAKLSILLANNPEKLKSFMLFDILPTCSYLTHMIRSITSMEKFCLHVKGLVPDSIDWEAFFCRHWRQNLPEANLILDDIVNAEDIHNSLGEMITNENFRCLTLKFGETDPARKVRDDFFLNIICYWHSKEFLDYTEHRCHFAELWPRDRNRPFLEHPKSKDHLLYIRPCNASTCDYAFRVMDDVEDQLYIKGILTGQCVV
uniref:FBA_2 domain-containing protein n=1 Tax=Steinernema glaseri TaxID=37863 RepID=A0A1I7YMR3_9BILA